VQDDGRDRAPASVILHISAVLRKIRGSASEKPRRTRKRRFSEVTTDASQLSSSRDFSSAHAPHDAR
jgi:hypothetical protein